MNFKDKVVWITGASSGIGEALANELNNLGAKLILSARNEEKLNQLKLKFLPVNQNVHILPLNLEDKDSLPSKAKEAIEIFQRMDIIINAGGISQRSLAVETASAVEKKIMNINFWGTVMLSKAVLPIMIAQKQGQIVAISSLMGKFGTQYRSSYAASKHALHGYFDSLRCEVFNKGISITIVCPGFVKTLISVNSATADGSIYGKMDKNQQNGMSAEHCAKKILEAVSLKKEELLIGGKEKYGVLLKRFFPKYFSNMIRNRDVI